jgi:hypothetical protein
VSAEFHPIEATPARAKNPNMRRGAASLANLKKRWAKHVRLIKRKRRRTVSQLRNLVWWKKGKTPNPAGRAVQPGAKRTEKGVQGLIAAPARWNEISRQARAELEARRYQEPATEDVRTMQNEGWTPAEPEAAHPCDWHAARVAARRAHIIGGHHTRRRR